MSIQSTTPIINNPEIIAYIVLGLSGKINIITGSGGTSGSLISYTPANGIRFMPIMCRLAQDPIQTIDTPFVFIRNNGTVRTKLLGGIPTNTDTMTIGDIIIGTGAITYDMFLQAPTSAMTVYVTMSGVIA